MTEICFVNIAGFINAILFGAVLQYLYTVSKQQLLRITI